MNLDYSFLQHYWWFLVSLLGALLVFLLFVQGGQSLLCTLAKTETRTDALLQMLGKKWELTFTTLVTFGGAFFASFPLFYSTSFGGAYWVWMAILFSFVVQAVSYEFIARRGNLLGRGGFKLFLLANGVLAPVLLGAAVSTFFHGAEFSVNRENLSGAIPVISSWTNSLHGLEAVGNPWNVALGLAIFFLSRLMACLYFLNNVEDEEFRGDIRRSLLRNTIAFLAFFLPWLVCLFTKSGLAAADPAATTFVSAPYLYLNTLLFAPWILLLLLAGLVLVLSGIALGVFKRESTRGFWLAAPGVVFTVLALLLCAAWNGTAYYPSLSNPQSSLTLANSCSSPHTLSIMAVVSLFIPVVLAYVAWVWRVLDRKSPPQNTPAAPKN